MSIHVITFSAENKNYLEDFYLLRKRVFFDELHWGDKLLATNHLSVDKFAHHSSYFAAIDHEMLGGFRIIPYNCGSPYSSMVSHHLNNKMSFFNVDNVTTLTTMMVLKDYRGKNMVIDVSGQKITIAASLINKMEKKLSNNKETQVVIANVSLTRAVYFFYQVGFRMIDPVFMHDDHPYPIIDMAMCVNSSFKESKQEAYINDRQRNILGNTSFFDYIKKYKQKYNL